MSFVHSTLTSAWNRRGLLAWLLLPLSLLFGAVSALRRALYRLGVLRAVRLPRPVVVVGNVTVGGAGKTPLTLWLAGQLKQKGWRPGIVSRGYGGAVSRRGEVREVRPGDDAAEVGDEPLLMAGREIGPVWIGRDRARAGLALIEAHPECDLILCDDGLQHYRLGRDVEIVVMDVRGGGNRFLLPAGPLREPMGRISKADALVLNGAVSAPEAAVPVFSMRLVGDAFRRLDDPAIRARAEDFPADGVHAIAGMGNPARFFEHLAGLGLTPACHAFPDHHPFQAEDLHTLEGAKHVLMTEKDGVKCAPFAASLAPVQAWVLPVEAELDPALSQLVVEKLNGRAPA